MPSLVNTTYRILEEENNDNEYILLLLKLKDIKELNKAYPNYFLNTKYFVDILEKYQKKMN